MWASCCSIWTPTRCSPRSAAGGEPLSVYAADGLLLYSNLDTPLKPGGNILERTGVAAELTFCHRYTSVHLPLDEYLTSNHVLLVLVILLVEIGRASCRERV